MILTNPHFPKALPRKPFLLPALALLAFAAMSAAQSVTRLNDNFTGAVRVGSDNNWTGVDRDGGTSNDYALALNNPDPAIAKGNAKAPNVTAGIDGNSLTQSGGTAYSLSTYFTPTTLGAGESISVALKIRTSAVPAAADISFRIGLFDSNAGGPIPGNTVFGGDGAFTDDRGYAAFYDTGAGAHEIRERTASVNQNVFSPNSSAYGTLGASDTTTSNVASNTTYPVSLNITRSPDGLSLTTTSTFNGITISLADTETLVTDFDHLGIFFSSAWGGTQWVDDVLVTYNPGVDNTAPTLPASSIVSNQGGGPVFTNTPVTFTVTFSEDMNDNTVDASDFGNAGTAPISIGAVTEITPGVFSVVVTPTGTGSLQLKVLAGAVLNDTAGNPLDTNSAIIGNTSITVSPYSPPPVGGISPNVIVILTDDQGWADIGYNNANVYTPNLDSLASQGVRFARHYSMSQCSPTRTALMTGRYPSRFGPQAQEAGNDQCFPPGTLTMAGMLGSMGYETAITGKWHLGAVAAWGPLEHGFQRGYGSFDGAVGMYDHRYRPNNPFELTWHRDHVIIPGYENGTHATDLVAREAIRFIQKQRDNPFFLYLPFHAPHTPLDERGSFVNTPTQLDPANPNRWLNEANIPWFNDPLGKIQAEPDPEKRLFLAALHHLDDAIGKVVAALEETGQRKNTILMFSSDNGPQISWPGNAYPDDLPVTNFNQPDNLRGAKTDVYEGGILVPGFINWPAKISPRIVTEPVHIIDWMPTLAAMTGYQPSVNPQWDGTDISPLIFNTGSPGTRTFYWLWKDVPATSTSNRWAVRQGDWKIVRYGAEPTAASDWQLFNLATDPQEATNVAASNTQKRNDLHQLFLLHRASDVTGSMVSPRLSAPSPVTGAFTVNANFTTTVTGLALSDFEVTNGTASNLAGSGSAYTLTITPTVSTGGIITIRLPAAAVSGSGMASVRSNALNVGFGTVPTELSANLFAPWATSAASILVAVEFSAPVTGLTISDFTITNSLATTLSGSGSSYQLQITPAAPGIVRVDLGSNPVTEGPVTSTGSVTHWKDYYLWANALEARADDPTRRYPEGDADADQRSNFEEYLYGGNPELPDNRLSSASLVVAGATGDIADFRIGLRDAAAAGGATTMLEYSADLLRWFPPGGDLTGVSDPPPEISLGTPTATPLESDPVWGDLSLYSFPVSSAPPASPPAKLFLRMGSSPPSSPSP